MRSGRPTFFLSFTSASHPSPINLLALWCRSKTLRPRGQNLVWGLPVYIPLASLLPSFLKATTSFRPRSFTRSCHAAHQIKNKNGLPSCHLPSKWIRFSAFQLLLPRINIGTPSTTYKHQQVWIQRSGIVNVIM